MISSSFFQPENHVNFYENFKAYPSDSRNEREAPTEGEVVLDVAHRTEGGALEQHFEVDALHQKPKIIRQSTVVTRHFVQTTPESRLKNIISIIIL